MNTICTALLVISVINRGIVSNVDPYNKDIQLLPGLAVWLGAQTILMLASICNWFVSTRFVKGESIMNLPNKKLSTWFMVIYFLLSGLHGVVSAFFPSALWVAPWPKFDNELWGGESLLAICIAVLIFIDK